MHSQNPVGLDARLGNVRRMGWQNCLPHLKTANGRAMDTAYTWGPTTPTELPRSWRGLDPFLIKDLSSQFPILCLPGDKLFQSKDVEASYCLPPVVHAFHGNKVDTGKKLRQREWQGLCPLAVSLIGDDQLHHYGPPHRKRLCARKQTSSKAPCRRAAQTHSDTCVDTPESVDASGIPHHNNQPRPWPQACRASHVLCGQDASLQLPTKQILLLLVSLQAIANRPNNLELAINKILASHADPSTPRGN